MQILLILVLQLFEDPTIGACEGTHYEVLDSEEILKPDATNCGFNDLSLPNPAYWLREKRAYEQCKDGKLVRKWVETVDVKFLRCNLP